MRRFTSRPLTISDMDIVALKVFFKDDDVTVGQSCINEVVDEQIDPNARRCTKNCGMAQSDDSRALQKLKLCLHFCAAVNRQGLGREFRANDQTTLTNARG
ncbi:MAG: hypothetical protein QOF24_184 [Verrucomicrobiota bacterium]